MSLQTVYAHKAIGFADLTCNSRIIDCINEPIAIIKDDNIKAYLIPERMMYAFADYLDDIKLVKMANNRIKNWEDAMTEAIQVNIDDL